MRKIILSLAFAAISISAPAAMAQGPTDAAKALIDAQHATDVFQALPNSNGRLVRHKQSGMFCLFANGTEAELQVFATKPELRGQDVGCIQKQANGAELAMFATHIPSATAGTALASMVRSMNQWVGWASTPTPDSHPEIFAKDNAASAWPRAQAAFQGVLKGRPTFVRLAAATTPDGWVVSQRVVTPLDAKGGDPEHLKADAHMKSEMIFSETLRVMVEERKGQ
jgi:hypothetical protein